MILVAGICQFALESVSFKWVWLIRLWFNRLWINKVALVLLILLSCHAVFATEPLVDINRAGAEELAEKLSGIGPAKSQAIVDYRESHGPFKTVDELINVKGIGPRTLEKNRPQLTVSNTVNAKDRLANNDDVNTAITSSGVYSRVITEKETHRAVRSVIETAKRDSITRKR